MTRLLTLTLLVLAVTSAAFANSIDLSNGGQLGSTANLSGAPTDGQPFSISDQLTSSLGTVTITTDNLVGCGAGCFSFSGGTVAVLSNSSQVLFQGTFGNGSVNTIAGFILLSVSPGDGFESVQLVITPSGMVSGSVVLTPEPSSLGLLGTGLLGLAGICRRKWRA